MAPKPSQRDWILHKIYIETRDPAEKTRHYYEFEKEIERCMAFSADPEAVAQSIQDLELDVENRKTAQQLGILK